MASTRPAPLASPTLWLDVLPPDLRERVAIHVSAGAPNASLQNLALSSPAQRAAACAALSHELAIPASHGDRLAPVHAPARWAELLSTSIAALDVTELERTHAAEIPRYEGRLGQECPPLDSFWKVDLHSRNLDYVLALLRAPTLTRAAIVDEPPLLRAVTAGAAVRDLTVFVTSRDSHDLLFDTLEQLNLHKLTLVCGLIDMIAPAYMLIKRFPCPLAQPSFVERAEARLAAVCSRLSSLKVECDCYQGVQWKLAPRLPALRELAIDFDIPNEALPLLRSLDSVRVSFVDNVNRIVTQIGPGVTQLEMNDIASHATVPWVRAEDIAALSGCTRLEKLVLNLSKGVEDKLPGLLRETPALRELQIKYDPAFCCERYYEAAYCCERYYEATPGALVSAIKSAQKLSKLSLLYVALEREEVMGILESTGVRLRFFEIAVEKQCEAEDERLEALMQGVIKHTSGLRRFVVDPCASCNVLNVLAEELLQQRKDRLLATLRVLQRRVPHLETMEVERYIGELVTRE